MYICTYCKKTFKHPNWVEENTGFSGMFEPHHYETFALCPYCGRDDFEEIEQEEEEQL